MNDIKQTVFLLVRYNIYNDGYDIEDEENDEYEEYPVITPSYPSFEVIEYRLGFYTSVEQSEAAMKQDIENWKTGDDSIYCYFVKEYPLDYYCCYNKYGYDIYSCRSYLPNGDLLDANLTPGCPYIDDKFPRFWGRTPEHVRFKKNDFVEVLDGDHVYLGIVYNPPPAYRPATEEEEKNIIHMDNSDDSYLVVYLEKGVYEDLINGKMKIHPDDEYWEFLLASHCHPLCVNVFPPRLPVPDKLREFLFTLNNV
jgi:hypothetical protein